VEAGGWRLEAKKVEGERPKPQGETRKARNEERETGNEKPLSTPAVASS
jgi:hypothetical protein